MESGRRPSRGSQQVLLVFCAIALVFALVLYVWSLVDGQGVLNADLVSVVLMAALCLALLHNLRQPG